MSVKLIHVQISSVRLTHSCAMGVKLIYIEIPSVRLSHIDYGCVHIKNTSVRYNNIYRRQD